MKYLSRLFITGLALSLAGGAFAQDRAMIVLDGSGSMWGQIDGVPKLEIARQTLREVLAGVSPELELGLMAYGHRERGNCDDIEVLVPTAAGTADAIAAAADAMRFQGRTPLTTAVQMAAEELRYTENPATVILITDGIETCDADPCALASALEGAGIGFTAHVVGFGLSREEGREVACIAENTGGAFVLAEDPAALAEALTQTVAAVTDGGAAPAAEDSLDVVLPDASIVALDAATIGAPFRVEWTGPAAEGDYIDLVAPGAEDFNAELSYAYVADTDEGVATLRAPAEIGSYLLRYVWTGPDGRHVLAETPLEVGDAPIALIALDTVSAGQVFTVQWKGPDNEGDYLDIVPEGFAEYSGELAYAYTLDGSPATLQAPSVAGSYVMRYVIQGAGRRETGAMLPLTVTEATASLAFPGTVPAGSVIDVFFTGPQAPGDYLDVVPADQTATDGELDYFYTADAGEAGVLRAPTIAGSYIVRYVLQAPDGRRVLAQMPLVVDDAKATLTVPASVSAGNVFAITWDGPAQPGDYIDLVPAGYTDIVGELDYFYTEGNAGNPGELLAPETAGAYEVRYLLEGPLGRQVIASQPITVQ